MEAKKLNPAPHTVGKKFPPGLYTAGKKFPPAHCRSEEISKGTLCANESIEGGALCASFSPGVYRTKDGTAYYKFGYVQVGNHFVIDILEQPSYNGRDESTHVSHRVGKKICINPSYAPKTIEKAKDISADWAELTHIYITRGFY